MRHKPYYTKYEDAWLKLLRRTEVVARYAVVVVMLVAMLYIVGGMCYVEGTEDSSHHWYAKGFRECAELVAPITQDTYLWVEGGPIQDVTNMKLKWR